MSFATLDAGQSTSAPILAIRLQVGTQVWRYTSAEVQVTVDGEDYDPDVIGVETLRLRPSATDQRLAIVTRQDLPVLTAIQGTRPPVRARIYQVQRDDLTAWQIYWTGMVVSIVRDEAEAKLIMDAGTGRIDGLLAPHFFGASCQWTLGRPWCPVDLSAYAHPATVSAVSGTVVTASAWVGLGDGYFRNGHLVLANGLTEVIVDNDTAAGSVTLRTPLSVAVGDSVIAYAGCDGSQQVCTARFGAATNGGRAWGGFRVPTVDPVRGGII